MLAEKETLVTWGEVAVGARRSATQWNRSSHDTSAFKQSANDWFHEVELEMHIVASALSTRHQLALAHTPLPAIPLTLPSFPSFSPLSPLFSSLINAPLYLLCIKFHPLRWRKDQHHHHHSIFQEIPKVPHQEVPQEVSTPWLVTCSRYLQERFRDQILQRQHGWRWGRWRINQSSLILRYFSLYGIMPQPLYSSHVFHD